MQNLDQYTHVLPSGGVLGNLELATAEGFGRGGGGGGGRGGGGRGGGGGGEDMSQDVDLLIRVTLAGLGMHKF